MDTPRDLAAEAASHLAGTPWSGFDGVGFHRHAMGLARFVAMEGPLRLGNPSE